MRPEKWLADVVQYVMEPLTLCLLTDLGPTGLFSFASSNSKILEL